MPNNDQSSTPPNLVNSTNPTVTANSDPTQSTQASPTSLRQKEVLPTPIPNNSLDLENNEEFNPEYEPSQAELEPAIEKLEEEIKREKLKAPEQTVVRQDNADQPTPQTVSKPVIILPLSEQKMQEGKHKNPTFSLAWLYGWARRQIKKMKDILVVFRDSPYN